MRAELICSRPGRLWQGVQAAPIARALSRPSRPGNVSPLTMPLSQNNIEPSSPDKSTNGGNAPSLGWVWSPRRARGSARGGSVSIWSSPTTFSLSSSSFLSLAPIQNWHLVLFRWLNWNLAVQGTPPPHISPVCSLTSTPHAPCFCEQVSREHDAHCVFFSHLLASPSDY